MQAVLETPVSQDLLVQWWQAAGTLALKLPSDYRAGWLECVSQVIRHYRFSQRSDDPGDRQLYASLCQLSLSRTRAELSTLLTTGYVSFHMLQHIYGLEKKLEASLTA